MSGKPSKRLTQKDMPVNKHEAGPSSHRKADGTSQTHKKKKTVASAEKNNLEENKQSEQNIETTATEKLMREVVDPNRVMTNNNNNDKQASEKHVISKTVSSVNIQGSGQPKNQGVQSMENKLQESNDATTLQSWLDDGDDFLSYYIVHGGKEDVGAECDKLDEEQEAEVYHEHHDD